MPDPTPITNDPSTTPAAGTTMPAAGTSAAATSLTDDSLVQIPGQSEPVKYGDLYKRLQADHTKKSQEVGKLREAFEKERTTWESDRQQKEAYLQQVAAQLLARQQQGQAKEQTSPLDAIRALPYLDGATAAQLVESIQNQGIQPIVQAIAQRDEALRLLYGQLQKLQESFGGLQSERTAASFDQKISGFLKQLDLPSAYADLAKRIYLAYEGDDLDQEFPEILRNEIDAFETAARNRQSARLEAAKQPITSKLPGKGGQGTAGKALGLTGRENARETADYLWEALQNKGSEQT